MFNLLLFLSAYVAGFIFSFAFNPVMAFVLYEAVYFFNPKSRWWGDMVPNISYSFWVVVLMFVVYIYKYSEHKKNKIRSNPAFKWIYFLVAIYVLNYFLSDMPRQHFEVSILFIKTIITISVAYKICDTEGKLNYALYGYIFGAWYISFVAYQVGRNSGNRVEGIGTVDSPDANGIAAAVVPSLVICLYYFWVSSTKKIKLTFAVAGVFIANAIVLINSRGAFIAAAISILYFICHLYWSPLQRASQKITAVWIVVFGLAGLIYLSDDAFMERLYTMQHAKVVEEEETATTRLFFWRAAWQMAKDYPFGAGYRGFDYHADEYVPKSVATGGNRQRSVHSTWFEVLTEIGYLGLLSFIFLIASCFVMSNKCKVSLKEQGRIDSYFKIVALEAALLSFIIAMTFINRFRSEILYWCILYIACAYNIFYIKVQGKLRKY